MTYRIKFMDSVRFLASSLLNLAKNLVEGLHNSKVKVKDKSLIIKCIK